MALGDPYITVEELKSYLRHAPDIVADDAELEDAIQSASEQIEDFCGRQFNLAGSATARRFRPDADGCSVEVHDIATTTGLIVRVDTTGDGTYDTVVDAADFELHPIDGIKDQVPGWPYTGIVRHTGTFPLHSRRPHSVQVTARWGWAAVPHQVRQAAFILAAETYGLRNAPLGVAGFGDFGVVRVRDNRMAAAKLMRFRRDEILVG